jgi:hypothetical protein
MTWGAAVMIPVGAFFYLVVITVPYELARRLGYPHDSTGYFWAPFLWLGLLAAMISAGIILNG